MIPFIQANKNKIIRIANDPSKADKLPSARRVRAVKVPKTIVIPVKGASVKRLTIDDIGSFAWVRRVAFTGNAMPDDVSEKHFKRRDYSSHR